MICNGTVEKYCSDDISKIENYDKAINDTTQTWHCHHRLEIHDNGTTLSQEELKSNGMYYNRPASELIFLTRREHMRLHRTGKKMMKYTHSKVSETRNLNLKSKDSKLTLFKIERKSDGKIEWAKDRKELSKITGKKSTSITKVINELKTNMVSTMRDYIVRSVEVEVKEIVV